MKKVLALLLALVTIFSVTCVAFAEGSAEENPEYKIEVILDLPTPVSDRVEMHKDGETFTYTASDKDNYKFDSFVIEGKYENLVINGNTITFTVKGDCVVHVKYKDVTPTENPTDKTNTSPSTGSPVLVLFGLVMIGLCGAYVATRKLIRNK